MIIRYRFPYSRQREAELLGAHNLTPADRLPYYQTLSEMIERSFMLTEHLQAEAVPSILTFESTYQKQEDSGIICIYGVPHEPVTPVSQALFASDCNALSALSVFLRLAHVLRDINKSPKSPVLRYLDLDDVYLTQSNKILLSGFYYAAADTFRDPPAYLPDAAPIVPDDIRHGATGNPGTDMQILAQIAWNVFSGLPWDCAHTPLSQRIPPCYAPDSLRNALELGLAGDINTCNQFRKQLMQCYKELSKTDFAETFILTKKPFRKQFQFPSPPTKR